MEKGERSDWCKIAQLFWNSPVEFQRLDMTTYLIACQPSQSRLTRTSWLCKRRMVFCSRLPRNYLTAPHSFSSCSRTGTTPVNRYPSQRWMPALLNQSFHGSLSNQFLHGLHISRQTEPRMFRSRLEKDWRSTCPLTTGNFSLLHAWRLVMKSMLEAKGYRSTPFSLWNGARGCRNANNQCGIATDATVPKTTSERAKEHFQ